ncbi:MAG TPA: hypothetical protein VHR45_09455 [Thermoanaerobaculia bacterium]|nr:hypothetical protein [Thermoanaerobaculia bacterium]
MQHLYPEHRVTSPATAHRAVRLGGKLAPALLLPLLLLQPGRGMATILSLVDPIVSLPSSLSDGQSTLRLRAEAISGPVSAKGLPPALADNGPVVTVKFTVLQEVATSIPQTREWYVRTDVSHLPPKTTQARVAEVEFAGVHTTLSYTLTNQLVAPFTWSPKPTLATWSLSTRRIGLGIVQGPANDVKIRFCQLVEQSTKELLDCRRFHLCREVGGKCGGELRLGYGPNSIFLKMDDDFHPVGNFRGSVQVTALEKPDGESLALDIYGTTRWRAVYGVVVVAFGVGLAWAISVFARARIDRDQALIPAVLLSATLDKLLATLRQVPPQWSANVASTADAVHKLQDGLTEQYLDGQGWLPPRVPSPYPSIYSNTNYNQYLQKVTEHANMLGVIINNGMAKAWGLYKPGMSAAQGQTIANELKALDGLDARITPPSQAQAQQEVEKVMAQLAAALAGPPNALAKPSSGQPAMQPPTYRTLSFQVARLTWMIWLVLFLITVVTGYAALIQSKAGFGLARDYLVCFLWGLGLPVASLQLSALVPSSVSTALHLSILK